MRRSEISFVPFAVDRRLFLWQPPILITSYIFKCTILLLNDAVLEFEFQRVAEFNILSTARRRHLECRALDSRDGKIAGAVKERICILILRVDNVALFMRDPKTTPLPACSITQRKMRAAESGVRERDGNIPFEGVRFIENSIVLLRIHSHLSNAREISLSSSDNEQP